MTRVLIIILATALLALPLLAEEPKKSETTSETTTTAPAAAPAAAAPATPDSPLVALSKRSNRLGKKPANVITNETLKRSDGSAHITTTTEQRPLTMPAAFKNPPRPTPEMVAAERAAAKRKAEARAAADEAKTVEKQNARVAVAMEIVEEVYDDDIDPYQAEKNAQEQAAKQKDKKPPQD